MVTKEKSPEHELRDALEKVLKKLSKKKGFNFFLNPYNSVSEDNQIIYQGVEIVVINDRKKYYMKFPIIENRKGVLTEKVNGKFSPGCIEDKYLIGRKEYLALSELWLKEPHMWYEAGQTLKNRPQHRFLFPSAKEMRPIVERAKDHYEYTSYLCRRINSETEILNYIINKTVRWVFHESL